MIRILHIVHVPTRGGGLTNVVMNYYRNIDREKIQFDLLYFLEADNSFVTEIEALGGRTFKMSLPMLTSSFYKERNSFFKEHQGEWVAIHCHVLFGVSFFASVARRYGAKYVIAHSHSSSYGTSPLKKLRNSFFVRQAKALSDYHFACSQKAGEFMFGKLDNSIILNNAINAEMYRYNQNYRESIRKELNIQNQFVIGHIGSFAKSKNHEMLIDIFRAVLAQISDAVLVLVGGDGTTFESTKSRIVKKVTNAGIADRVKFLGLRNDVYKIVSAMDVLVMPSLFEGLPVSCVEAQASGLPCVLSDHITDEIGIFGTCFLSLADPIELWADKICCIASRPASVMHREDGYDAIRKAGYDITTQAKKLEQFYERL